MRNNDILVALVTAHPLVPLRSAWKHKTTAFRSVLIFPETMDLAAGIQLHLNVCKSRTLIIVHCVDL